MKLLAVFALALAATTATAQPAPAPAAPPAPDAAAATPAKLSINSTIETLVADAKAKAVLDANLPGLTSHPAFDQFKAMSLRAVQPFSGGVITDEALKKIEADLATIG